MILPHIAQLNTKRIILESGSPRRKELLKVLGLNKFEVGVAACMAPTPPQPLHTLYSR
jgi:predicted house-cleaning NTP pyrophosphatase (Maf/HAM1 superfamily)